MVDENKRAQGYTKILNHPQGWDGKPKGLTETAGSPRYLNDIRTRLFCVAAHYRKNGGYMHMKRSLFAVSLSLLVILSQAGCGGGGSTPSAGSSVAGSSDNSSAAGTTQTGATSTTGATPTGDTASTGGSTPAGGAGATAGSSATVGTGVAKLSWDATPAGAAGYKVYYGTSSKSYSVTVNIGTTPSYALSGLSPGTYYFVVTVYDASGNESVFSNEVSKTIS
jgi:hypothetical protein